MADQEIFVKTITGIMVAQFSTQIALLAIVFITGDYHAGYILPTTTCTKYRDFIIKPKVSACIILHSGLCGRQISYLAKTEKRNLIIPNKLKENI